MPKSIRLYHGSKSGIEGTIAPISRSTCDFGRGFYMGTERTQPLTLICNYEQAHLYTLEFDIEELSILTLTADLDWALFVACNRGVLSSAREPSLFRRYAARAKEADAVVGPIADDRMFVVLDRFFAGQITDTALVACLSALQLGNQYVAKTSKACQCITILEDHRLAASERKRLAHESEENRRRGVALADEICRAHRREGRFFDEIVEEAAQ